MSSLTATALSVFLVATPAVAAPASGPSDAVRLAAHGGFLLGSARYCGIASDRVVRAGQLVQALIAAAASDASDSEDAGGRFASFFVATAFPTQKDKKLPLSCKAVLREFEQFEAHNPGAEAL